MQMYYMSYIDLYNIISTKQGVDITECFRLNAIEEQTYILLSI